MNAGARATTTTQIPAVITQRMALISLVVIVAPLRMAMSAPKPTNTPAISAEWMNSSASCIARHLTLGE